MSKLTYQQRGNQSTRIPVGQPRTAGGKVLEDNRAAFAAKQLKQTESVQRLEEDELLNGKSGAVQRAKDGDEETAQAKFSDQAPPVQREEQPAKPNNTGLPDNLKNGIESLSGLSMDNVKVHYNSAKPQQLNALAYAQGTDIHVGPGQEKHLPHEAWHVVQQAQGRVRPTVQMKGGVPVNDDKGLEREADVMGARVLQMMVRQNARPAPASPGRNAVVQRCAPEFVAGNYAGANAGLVNGIAGEASALDNWLNANAGLIGVARGGFAPGPGQIAIIAADGLVWDGSALNQVFDYHPLRREIAANVLEEQLSAGGVPPITEPDQTQTHHIVEFGAAHADISRQILNWVNININSAVNGVHLPSVYRDDGGDASVHSGSHTDAYGDLVRDRLIAAVNVNRQVLHAVVPLTPATIGAYLGIAIAVPGDTVAITAALNQLRTELLSGDIELNSNTDMEWQP